MTILSDYANYDALGVAALVRSGQVTPADLVETALDAIERLNPTLNAVVTVLGDSARAAAHGSLPNGPFRGVPFLVKDLTVSLAGIPTDCGSRYFKGWTRDFDSEIVRRWRASGLVFVGKSNTPELGSSGSTEPVATGPTRNPWNLEHTPGGSSGGSSAAVAAGIFPAAHANDAGGSIRGPASCCGLVGMKPTRGRNSVGPDAAEYWSGMAADHVVTRTVRDAAALLDVTSGWSPGDPYGAPEPEQPYLEAMRVALGRLRIGFATRGPRGISFDPDCLEAVTRTASWLQALGHHVEEASPDWDAELLGLGVMDVFASDVARAIEDRHAATGIPPSNAVLERNNLWLWERGRRLSAIDLLRAESRLNVASRQFARFFENHDVWLTPTMAKLPPRLGHLYADVEDVETFFDRLWTFNPFNSVYNVSGQPAISLPLHMGKAGLPVGIMIGAHFGREDLLFRLAAQLEAAHPWADRHPPVSLWAKPGITA